MTSPNEFEKVVCYEEKMPVTPSRLSLSEDADAETVAGGTQDTDDDNISILSTLSYPDPLGRKDL